MQLFCVEMMKRLNIQRRNEHFCDVILEVGSGDDQARLEAHRNVLCAASPFFYNALNSDMKEKKEGVIRLQETSKAVMEEVLEYLYTGHVDINEHNAFDLMAAADFLLMPSLKALCSNAILQALTFSNSVAAYYLAVKYRCDELQKKAKDFILANFVALAETEDFLNLTVQQVEEWISSDEIVVKGEEEVFEILMKWMERNESQKECFYNLFRHIRCIYVPRDYFVNIILPDPIVKDNPDCSNLAIDVMKMVFSGQEECYFAQSPRNCLKTHEDAIVACGGGNTFCYIPSENKRYKLACPLSTLSYVGQTYSSCQGKLFRIGGNRNDYRLERYDPSVNTWSPLKSIQQTFKFSSVVAFLGFLYAIGGLDDDNSRLSTVQRYNPDTHLWQVMPSLSVPRSSVCAVADGNHLYAIGGNSSSGYLDIAERFDPKEKSWSRIASTVEKRRGAGGAAVNQKVFVFGGILKQGASNTNFCEVYDPAIDMWSSIASTFDSRSYHKPVSVASLKEKIYMYVCGDFEQDDSQEKTLQVYDAVTSE